MLFAKGYAGKYSNGWQVAFYLAVECIDFVFQTLFDAKKMGEKEILVSFRAIVDSRFFSPGGRNIAKMPRSDDSPLRIKLLNYLGKLSYFREEGL